LREKAARTGPDGRYSLALPPATYTITARGNIDAGATLSGEVRDVRVVQGHTMIIDITVT
jgi:hypothetical protein